MIELRPYQQKVIDDIISVAANGHRRVLVQACTGLGKTVIASAIMSHASSNGKKVLFLAHRRELIWQCSNKLDHCEISHGITLADYPTDTTHLIQVASIQSLHSKTRRLKMTLPPADIVIVDEAHHQSSSKTWQTIISAYPEAFIIGLTATPINKRGIGLGTLYDGMVVGPSMSKAIEDKWLVPARYFAPSIPDLSGLRTLAGDYIENELEQRMDKQQLIGDIVENWSRICPDRKTIVFATGVKHSIHIAETFMSCGISAAHIDGTTPKEVRDNIVKEFKTGSLKVLTNCAVFTEGFDCPEASCLVFARPTKSLLLYLQVAGRVLRPSEGKEDCIIIDHAGVVYEHGTIDQEWDWKLDYGSKKTVNDVMRDKIAYRKKRQITCEQCKSIYEGRLDCPSCHWKPMLRGKPVDTFEAYLVELGKPDQEAVLEDRQTWYQALKGYQEKNGKKPGWTYYKYIAKFKTKPPWRWRDLPGIETPTIVMAWIKYQNIKFAKSRRCKSWSWKNRREDHIEPPHGFNQKELMAQNGYVQEE